MKKLIPFLVLYLLISQVNATTYTKIKPILKASELFVTVGNTGKMISLQELSVINVKDFEELTGKKMSVAEKLMLKGAQKQLRSHIQKDGTLDKSLTKSLTVNQKSSKKGFIFGGGISWIGLALGVFLSIIGVLIAYLVAKDDKSMIRWAWIGFVISLIIWGAVLI